MSAATIRSHSIAPLETVHRMHIRCGGKTLTRCCSTTRVPRARMRGKVTKWLRSSKSILGEATSKSTPTGHSYRITTQYVVDATGRDTFMSSKKRLRRKNMEHQSAAIFGHFRGAECRPGEDAGNISIYRFEHGWIWMIPLPKGVMSIGAVCRPAYLKQRKGKTVDFLMETLNQNEGVRKRIEQAELIGDEVRVTGNYSYDSTQMGGLDG
jgi:flavin-dependent dehydrogenase